MNNVILLIAVLICPITMGTMMFFMMRGQHKDSDNDTKHKPKRE